MDNDDLPQELGDQNLFAAPEPAAPPDAPQTPDASAAPAQDPLAAPEVQLAIEQARTAAYRDALGRPIASQATTPVPNDPLDLLNDQQREQLNSLFLTDPMAGARFVSDLAARHQRALLEAEAAPLVTSQASTLVELFKSRMSAIDGPLGARIAPLFDASLAGLDLRPLVRMAPDVRENELQLRWRSAKAQVLEAQMRAAPPKPAPLLTAEGAAEGRTGGPKASKLERDPYLARMAAEYKFTPEQIKEIEEVM